MDVLQQVCLQIVFPPATCCSCSLLQLLECHLSLTGSVIPCSHGLQVSACQKKSNIHLSAAQDNTFKFKMVSINQFSIFSGTGVRKKADRVSIPTFPTALIPNTSIIPNCTTRLGSERGFYLTCAVSGMMQPSFLLYAGLLNNQ